MKIYKWRMKNQNLQTYIVTFLDKKLSKKKKHWFSPTPSYKIKLRKGYSKHYSTAV